MNNGDLISHEALMKYPIRFLQLRRKERIMAEFIYVNTKNGTRLINLAYVKEIKCKRDKCTIYFAGQEKREVETLEGAEAMWRLIKIANQK